MELRTLTTLLLFLFRNSLVHYEVLGVFLIVDVAILAANYFPGLLGLISSLRLRRHNVAQLCSSLHN